MDPLFHLGKNGIEETFLKQIDDALEAREILKISVLSNSGYGVREASDEICKELNCEGIQAIGSKIVIYRRSSKKPTIELP
jgi:RNA-binding protein